MGEAGLFVGAVMGEGALRNLSTCEMIRLFSEARAAIGNLHVTSPAGPMPEWPAFVHAVAVALFDGGARGN